MKKLLIIFLIITILIIGSFVVYYSIALYTKDGASEDYSVAGNMSIPDNPRIFTSSDLEDKSCLENAKLKVCFDDRWGGTTSGIYRKDFSPKYNFVYPTAGGALQVDVRSKDVVSRCPGSYGDDWLFRWNPTQAGCEACWTTSNGTVSHVASNTANKTLTSSEYSLNIWPRSYFHNNANDCNSKVKYTSGLDVLDEDIFINQKAQIFSDYYKIEWDITHTGNHTHELDPNSKYFRQELPTFYVNDSADCFSLAYTDKRGKVQTKQFPCKKGSDEFIDFTDGWLSFYNPNNSKQALTVAAKNSVDSGDVFETTLRNYDSTSNGAQLDFSSFFNITPNMSFTVEFVVLPYKWDEVMSDGTKVVDFIANFEKGGSAIIPEDGDSTETGTDTICGALDTNSDKKVSIVDFAKFVKIYGNQCSDQASTYSNEACGAMDVNGDGKITIVDFASLTKKYGKPCN